MYNTTLPAGRYFVGDPCYAISDSVWGDFCDILFASAPGGVSGITSFMGKPMFASSTAYGDGCYSDLGGISTFGVDAGLIGAVPESLWEDGRDVARLNRLGHIIEMDCPFEAYVTSEHEFHIGPLIIPTDWDIMDGDSSDDDDDNF